MLDLSTTAVVERPEFAPEQPRFRVEPPAGNPLLAPPPLSFTYQDNHFDVAWVEAAAIPQRNDADALLGDIIDCSKRDVDRYPHSARAHANLGLAFLNQGRLAEATSAFEEALTRDPALYFAMASLARARVLQGQFDVAQALFSRLRVERPDDPNPVMSLADLAARRREYESAVRLWEEAIRLAPEPALPRYHLGLLLLGLDRHAEAIGHLKQAARDEVRFAAVHHGLGVAYAIAGNMRRAARAFKAALSLAPGMAEAIHGLAAVLLQQRSGDAAIDLLRDHLATWPDDRAAHDLLAAAYVHQKDYKAARSQLFHTLELTRRAGGGDVTHQASLINNLGVCYWMLRNRGEAIRQFQRSIQVQPDADPIAYHNLARLLLEAREARHAREILAACASRFPWDQETHVLLAAALQIQGAYNEAIAELRQVIQAGKAHVDVYKMLGTLLTEAAHDPAAALVVLNEAYRHFPEDAVLLNNLAYTYLVRGDLAAARSLLQSAPKGITGSRADIVLQATRGLLALKEGDFATAARGYDGAADLANRRGQHTLARTARQKKHLEFARAHLERGENAAAQQEVRRGLAVRGGNDLYRRHLELLDQLWHNIGHDLDC